MQLIAEKYAGSALAGSKNEAAFDVIIPRLLTVVMSQFQLN